MPQEDGSRLIFVFYKYFLKTCTVTMLTMTKAPDEIAGKGFQNANFMFFWMGRNAMKNRVQCKGKMYQRDLVCKTCRKNCYERAQPYLMLIHIWCPYVYIKYFGILLCLCKLNHIGRLIVVVDSYFSVCISTKS